MKVAQLIERLKELDPELLVLVEGHGASEGFFFEARAAELMRFEKCGKGQKEWFGPVRNGTTSGVVFS